MRVRRRGLQWVIGTSLFTIGFLLGYLVENNHLIPVQLRSFVWAEAPIPEGRWKTVRTVDIGALPDEEALEALESIGYVGAVHPQRIHERGVTLYAEERAQPGFNLYCSGHGPVAVLTDMQGREIHRWEYALPLAWRSESDPAEAPDGRAFWRRVHLFENGDLLVIFEGIGLVRINKDSELLWARQCNAHHDVWVNSDGSIDVLTREGRTVARVNEDVPILEDFISTFDGDGNLQRRISLLQCIERSMYAPILDYIEPAGDFMHTNTITVLDGRQAHRSPFFRAGNILVSFRNMNLIGIVDPIRERLVWAATGMWRLQHEPVLLDNGRMLVFDNQGYQGFSRVIEFDALTREVTWNYDDNLFSEALGAAYGLPNGNTLIVESNNGRVIEVTRDKQTVWEFVNPHLFEPAPELVPIIPDCVRIPKDFPLDWADAQPPTGPR